MVEQEVITPEKANFQSIGNLDVKTKCSTNCTFDDPDDKTKFQTNLEFDENEPVVKYHVAAERCANLSIWCAAMAGAEILKRKKAFGHGKGFTEWRKQLPFSDQTALNYVNLAKKLEEKLNALPAEELAALLPAINQAQAEVDNRMTLLQLPSPTDVFNPAHEKIAAIVKHVTSGQTLTQLYFDWGIVKQPAQLGGYHPSDHVIPTGEARKKIQAEGYWTAQMLAALHDEGCVKKSWSYLSHERLLQIREICSIIARDLKDVLANKKA